MLWFSTKRKPILVHRVVPEDYKSLTTPWILRISRFSVHRKHVCRPNPKVEEDELFFQMKRVPLHPGPSPLFIPPSNSACVSRRRVRLLPLTISLQTVVGDPSPTATEWTRRTNPQAPQLLCGLKDFTFHTCQLWRVQNWNRFFVGHMNLRNRKLVVFYGTSTV